jgi:hypothetical protein
MQAPGGTKEDRSGGFKYGGWTVSYGDEAYGKAVQKELQAPAIFFWAEKHLISGRATGLNMQIFGRALITEQNISCRRPGKIGLEKFCIHQKPGGY